MKVRIKKGDTVKVIAGKDRGKAGKIVKVFPDTGRLVVDGVNIYKKHVRPKRQGEKGEIVNVSRSLHVSNVMLVCSACGKPTRLGVRTEKEKKMRICRRCKAAA